MNTCRVPDCERDIVYKRSRLCSAHRLQERRGEMFTYLPRRKHPDGPCDVEGCGKPQKALGMCVTHYGQHYHGREIGTPKKYVKTTARDDAGNKWCGTCATWRPESNFASSKDKLDGLQTRCRDCNAAIYRSRAELVRDQMRQYRFGLDREQFDAMFAAQGSACAICRSDSPGTNFWSVDHDHACCPGSKVCGQCVRGILCSSCNHALGHAKDRPDVLRAAADYLDAHAASREVAA